MVADSETFDGLLGDARAFCEVVDFKSLSAAARRLGQSKGAISRRITRLESNLGARLLARSSRAVTATEEGMAFHAKVQAALALLDEAADGARGSRDVPRGNLRITSPIDVSVFVLPPILTAFRQLYPQITVEIFASDLPLDLAAHRIDLAFRIAVGDLPDQAYRAVVVAESWVGYYASSAWVAEHGTPRQPLDIADWPLIVSEKQGESRALRLRDARGRMIETRGKAELRASDFATVLGLAEASAGLALLPELIARSAVQRGALLPLLGEWTLPGVKLHALSLAGREMPARVRLFRDFMREWLRTH